jgi:hypothetical protein
MKKILITNAFCQCIRKCPRIEVWKGLDFLNVLKYFGENCCYHPQAVLRMATEMQTETMDKPKMGTGDSQE